MNRLMLDTNTASYVIRGNPPEVRRRLASMPMNRIVISVVTQAELLYGLARKGNPAALGNLVQEFLLRVQILAWDEDAARVYGGLRAACAASGISVAALDMMIAAHAVAAEATLITHDKIFGMLPERVLSVEDWVANEPA